MTTGLLTSLSTAKLHQLVLGDQFVEFC